MDTMRPNELGCLPEEEHDIFNGRVVRETAHSDAVADYPCCNEVRVRRRRGLVLMVRGHGVDGDGDHRGHDLLLGNVCHDGLGLDT